MQNFKRFIRACALRSSQVLNYSDLARDTGIAPNTARKWLGLLQTSAVVTLIETHYGNRTKRLIKSPKLVFLDMGLAVFLAGFRAEEDLFHSSLGGPIWESYVFGQILRHAGSLGESTTINYWRTANGPEVDLVLDQGGERLVAIECKLKERHDLADSAGLRALGEAEIGRIKNKFIVCRTKATYKLSDGTWVVNVSQLLKNLKSD